MPRGVRTVTNGFEKANFGEETTSPAQGAPENGTINVNLSKKYIVGTGVDPENIIRFDREGIVLVFEQTDKFLPLSEGVLESLSRENRLRYSMAKEFHDAWRGDEHAKLVESFKVDRQMMGSARDKLKIKGSPDMEIRWARPDNVERYRAKGYKVLSADEAESFLGPKDGHHEVGRLGDTQLVAMGIPKAVFDQRAKEKAKKNVERAGAWKVSGLQEVNRSGAQGFVATDDDRRRWTEAAQGSDDDQ